MILPSAKTVSTSRDMTEEFQGYNHNLRIAENQFYDMKNLTTDAYPLLSPRPERGYLTTIPSPNGLYATDKLVWVSGTKLYYDNQFKFDVTDSEKTFVTMGAYLIVFPDKIAYNTYTDTVIQMEVEFEPTANVSYTLCKVDGINYENVYVGDTEPSTTTYTLWLDTSTTPNVLKQYDSNASEWVSVATTYVKLTSTGIGKSFNEYDAVTITGSQDTQFNTDMIIYAKGDDYIVVAALIDAAFTQDISLHPMLLSRTVPDMDFVCEHENRIWGCSSSKHEIYACKQGDPLNWKCYMGISSDSYAATIGSPGKFTGAIAHAGYILFFKENVMHRVYGTMPSNYQISSLSCRGVEEGSHKSMVVVNEILFYKGRNGVCAYDGSLPAEISSDFGLEDYALAVAGGLHNKYYVSMRDMDYMYHLFVYDTVKHMWMHEDNTQARWFTYCNGGLYYIDIDNNLMVVNNEKIYRKLFPLMPQDQYSFPNVHLFPNKINEGSLESYMSFTYPDDALFPQPELYIGTRVYLDWFAESGEIGISSPDNKYISKLQIRLFIEEQSSFKIEIMYDGSGVWEQVIELVAPVKKSYTIPIIIRRCDFIKIKFSGVGQCKLYSFAKVTEEGSEL